MTNAREMLSDDGKVVVMLCSQLGLSDNADASAPTPLTLSEWNALARKIHDLGLIRPAALFGLAAGELATQLCLTKPEAERIAQLLERGGSVAFELERLASRGIWCVTRADESYPAKLRLRLKHQAPPVLFGAGEISILQKPSVAVVGSRHLDEHAQQFARQLGGMCARISTAVVSGGARGADRLAMQSALENGGSATGVLADSLENTVRQPDVREFITDERLLLLTPYHADSGFSVGAAMGRNKLIYGLADFAVVVASDYEKGGTWAGAVEALKAEWCPVFVRSGKDVGKGHKELIKKGAIPLSETALDGVTDLTDWLKTHAPARPAQAELLPTTVLETRTPYAPKRASKTPRRNS